MKNSREIHSTALLFHLTIYAYQESYKNMIGSGSRAILKYVIPYLTEMLKQLGMPELSQSKTMDENMSIYISLIRDSGYILDAGLKLNGDNSYIFEVKDCKFASGGHDIFKVGHICPFAILAAAVIFYKTGAQISIEDSEFNEIGSKTLINVHERTRIER
jgi:hypothetical protein